MVVQSRWRFGDDATLQFGASGTATQAIMMEKFKYDQRVLAYRYAKFEARNTGLTCPAYMLCSQEPVHIGFAPIPVPLGFVLIHPMSAHRCGLLASSLRPATSIALI